MKKLWNVLRNLWFRLCRPAAKGDVEELKAARARWKDWLDGDPLHSINHQLSTLFWQDAIFRLFNHARKLADPGVGAAAISPILAPALDQGYLDGMIIGVTKLVEWSNPKHPKKGVISLRRLMDDVKAHRHLITRRNYLAVEGYPYDYAQLMHAEIAAVASTTDEGGVISLRGGGDPASDWMGSERAHNQFDRLSGKAAENRHPDDEIRPEILSRLSKALDDNVITGVKTTRNKITAHAADQESRGAKQGRRGMSLDEVSHALQLLIGVRQVVQALIMNDSWRAGATPVPQYDLLQFLDKPFVAPENMPEMRKFWDGYNKEQDAWLHAGDEFIRD